MREFADDKADAAESVDSEGEVDEEPGNESSDEEYDEHEEIVDDDADEDEDEEEDDGDDDEDGEEDAIDIGSHIGLMFDDEEVFGTIIEFDDDEETNTIEEDGTGDLVIAIKKTCSSSERMAIKIHSINFTVMPYVPYAVVLIVRDVPLFRMWYVSCRRHRRTGSTNATEQRELVNQQPIDPSIYLLGQMLQSQRKVLTNPMRFDLGRWFNRLYI